MSYIIEKSHGNLQECYHVGIKIPDFTLVAVVYQLNPNTITKVFDRPNDDPTPSTKRLIDRAKKVIIKGIKKFGHTDFASKAVPQRFINIETGRLLSDKKVNMVGIATMFNAFNRFDEQFSDPSLRNNFQDYQNLK